MNKLIWQLIDLLEPLLETVSERQAQFRMALGISSPLFQTLVWEGDTQTFIVNAVDKLHREGELITFLESVHAQCGIDIQKRIDTVIIELKTLPASMFTQLISAKKSGIRVFLSYARADDEPFVERLYDDLTDYGFNVWFDRASMSNQGLTFSQVIRDAIDAAERFVLVAGEAAFKSEYVRAEWEYALSRCKPVNIVLRKCTYKDLPAELAIYDAPDFRDDTQYLNRLETLLRQLNETVAPLGELNGVPEFPPKFLSRTSDIEKLRDLVIADIHIPTVISAEKRMVALEGMGGIGKTVLAIAFAKDCLVQRAFPDGIIWLTVGQKLSSRLLYQQLGRALGDNLTNYPIDENTCKISAQNILAGKHCLVILDDVWELDIAKAFRNLISGTSARLLITTRNLQINDQLGANEHKVGLFNESQSIALLRNWIGHDDPDLAKVAKKLDYLPLALRLAGARMALDKLSPAEYIAKFDRVSRITIGPSPKGRDENLEVSISLGVEAVFGDNQEQKLLYYTFGIFPEDVNVPQTRVLKLWKVLRPDIDEFELERILTTLSDLALIERNVDNETVSLHDLLHSYTQEKLGALQTQVQQALLSTYKSESVPWYQVDDDGYIFQHLIYHLLKAGYYQDIERLGDEIEKYPEFLHIANGLSRYYRSYANDLHPILLSWLNNRASNTLILQIVASIAVVYEIEDILKGILIYPNEKIQFFVVQDSYNLWQKNPRLTQNLLSFLDSQISWLRWQRSIIAVNALFRCSLFIGLSNEISSNPDPKTVPALLQIWGSVFKKFFFVTQITPLESALKRIRRRVVGLLVSFLIKNLRGMMDSSINSIFNFSDISAFFPASQERAVIIKRLLPHLDAVAGNAPESLEELIAFIKNLIYQGDNDSITAYVGLGALLAHAFRDPLKSTILLSDFLEELDNFYAPMKDTSEFTATIWYTVIGLALANFDIKSFDRDIAHQILTILMNRRFVLEQRYYTGHKFASGAIFRGNSCVGSVWGYELEMPDIGHGSMKRYLDLLIERNDFQQINNSIYALIEGIDYYSMPTAAFEALSDALRILDSYLKDLSQERREKFWKNFTETLVTYGSRHHDHLNLFLKQHGDDLLPEKVKTLLSNIAPSEDFDRIFSVIILLFVRKTLEDQDSPVRELIKWGIGQAAEASSIHNLIMRWIVRICNLIYSGPIVEEF